MLRKYSPDVPVTTNFMRRYPLLDYSEMAKELDIISWDSYPFWNNDGESLWETAAKTAFDHSLMRSLKRERPFMLMESTPSQVNWHPYNKLQRPGIQLLSSLQAVACGSDTVQYFQWRKSRGSYEQHHGAVVDHLGSPDTRVFKEVAEVGALLEGLADVAGSTVKARAAIIYDWPNRWAIEDAAGMSKERKYCDTCAELYAALMELGADADVISSEESLDGYELVVAPMLYLLKPGTARNLTEYVRAGGSLVATYLTGYVNENTLCYLGGFPGGGLKEVFGLYSEELDPLYPTDRNAAIFTGKLKGTYEIRDFCEIIKPTAAKTLAVYGLDFYKGQPVVTVNSFGAGKAYYAAARIERAGMASLFRHICGLSDAAGLPRGVEYHRRADARTVHHFYLNWTDAAVGFKAVDGWIELEPYGFSIRSDTKPKEANQS